MNWSYSDNSGKFHIQKCGYCHRNIQRRPLPECPIQHLENWEKTKKQRRVRTWKEKRRVVLLLGGKCVVCGIKDARVLQINHINGNGRIDRHKYSTLGWYIAILNGKRSIIDLELRCANCNVIYEYERGRLSYEWYDKVVEEQQAKEARGINA